jgi:hypothetical protein
MLTEKIASLWGCLRLLVSAKEALLNAFNGKK